MVQSQEKAWWAGRKQTHTKQMTGGIRVDFGSTIGAVKCFLAFLSVSLEWPLPISHLAARETFSKCKPDCATNSTMAPHCLHSKGQIPGMGCTGTFSSFAWAPFPPPALNAKDSVYGSSKQSCSFTYLCLCQVLFPLPRMPWTAWKKATQPFMELTKALWFVNRGQQTIAMTQIQCVGC